MAPTSTLFWLVFRLFLLHSAVIIYEDKGTFVMRVGIPLRSSVTWAEVTLERESVENNNEGMFVLHTEGSYFGRVIFVAGSRWPLSRQSAFENQHQQLRRLTAMAFSSYAEKPEAMFPAMGCNGDGIYRLGSGPAYS